MLLAPETLLTVRVGTQPNIKALRQVWLDAGVGISYFAEEMLERVEVATEPMELRLAIITVADLNLPEGTTDVLFFEEALNSGLRLCPAEVGLQYRPQPLSEESPFHSNPWLMIAMDPIEDSLGNPRVFRTDHRDGNRGLGSIIRTPRSRELSYNLFWAFVYN